MAHEMKDLRREKINKTNSTERKISRRGGGGVEDEWCGGNNYKIEDSLWKRFAPKLSKKV